MRKTRLSLPEQVARRMWGRVNFYYDQKRKTVVARKWPRKRGKQGAAVTANNQAFATVVSWLTQEDALISDTAKLLSKGTDYLWRDLLMAAAYGKLVEFQCTDGNTYQSGRENLYIVQNLLDSITNIVGSLLVRTSTGWQGMSGGTAGQVLVINEDGLPDFETLEPLPSIADGDVMANTSGASGYPVGTTLSALLDYVFSASESEGAILVRGSTGWEILAAGADGYVLTSNGTDAVPSYAPVEASPAQKMPLTFHTPTGSGWNYTPALGINCVLGTGYNGTWSLPSSPNDGDYIALSSNTTDAYDITVQCASGQTAIGTLQVTTAGGSKASILMQHGYTYDFYWSASQSAWLNTMRGD